VVALLYRQQTTGVCGSVESSLLNTSALIQLLRACDPVRDPGPRLDEDRLGYSSSQRLYQLRDAWICVCATTSEQRASFERAIRGWDIVPGEGVGSSSEDEQLSAALAIALSLKSLEQVTAHFTSNNFGQWTVCQSLEERARGDKELFVEVVQPPWGSLLEPLKMPVFKGQQSSPVAGAAARPGEDDERILSWLSLGQEALEALIDCGAMNREPAAVTFTASSV
jgi:crotonobetainyl-CoA:carnitine CoA-transferase CaiB-like acyl-CoA transferase